MTRSFRLLLLAMSGVRCRDAELMKVGLTLPGFMERSKVIASLPSLGLLTLAGRTPPDWEVHYREFDDVRQESLAQILQARYDLVAISSLSARILDAYDLGDTLRAQGIPVVIGGLHASAMPAEAASHADAVVQGEGEAVWQQLLDDARHQRLRPFYSSFHSPSRFDFTQASIPRYDLLSLEKYNRLTLQTTRGCPLNCSFCGASRTISPFRLKPVPQIRRELEAILAVWPRPFIELADDNTFVNKPWAKDLVRMLSEYPIRWFTETDISVADDPELLDLLASSRCAQVLVGLESARPASLKGIDAANWKYRRSPGYIERIRRIQSHGISVNGCFILGLDTDTPETFEATRDFVRDAELAEVQITLLTPFPGTPLQRQLKAEGRLLADVYWDSCTLFDITYRPKRLSPDELRERFRWLGQELYSDAAVQRRRGLFRRQLRAAHDHRKSPQEVLS